MGCLYAIVPQSGSSSCQSHLVVMRVSYSRCCCPRGKSLSSRTNLQVLVLVLGAQVLVLVLVLESQVLDHNTTEVSP